MPEIPRMVRELITYEKNGGAKGSRTPDLLNAIQALSQLSYGPTPRPSRAGAVSGEEVFGLSPINRVGGF